MHLCKTEFKHNFAYTHKMCEFLSLSRFCIACRLTTVSFIPRFVFLMCECWTKRLDKCDWVFFLCAYIGERERRKLKEKKSYFAYCLPLQTLWSLRIQYIRRVWCLSRFSFVVVVVVYHRIVINRHFRMFVTQTGINIEISHHQHTQTSIRRAPIADSLINVFILWFLEMNTKIIFRRNLTDFFFSSFNHWCLCVNAKDWEKESKESLYWKHLIRKRTLFHILWEYM